eukprot:Lithocolla_globosa_v1_NODE_11445_length_509_cov_1.400881.p2 type:complete len:115 gc:universal NODE_11445_length_509_cov_1.400881:364-20(-)
MMSLGPPFCFNVVERVGFVNRVTDQKDVSVIVGQGSQTIEIFLPSCVPQMKLYCGTVYIDVGHIVVKHGGDVTFRESFFGKKNHETSFSTRPVSNSNDFMSLGRMMTGGFLLFF